MILVRPFARSTTFKGRPCSSTMFSAIISFTNRPVGVSGGFSKVTCPAGPHAFVALSFLMKLTPAGISQPYFFASVRIVVESFGPSEINLHVTPKFDCVFQVSHQLCRRIALHPRSREPRFMPRTGLRLVDMLRAEQPLVFLG